MSYGYSARIIEANRQECSTRLGVMLGRLCIALDIPVNIIATDAGVSKQTVYNWFTGVCDPHPRLVSQIQKLVISLKDRK
mgnify:FL=1